MPNKGTPVPFTLSQAAKTVPSPPKETASSVLGFIGRTGSIREWCGTAASRFTLKPLERREQNLNTALEFKRADLEITVIWRMLPILPMKPKEKFPISLFSGKRRG